LYNLIPLLTLFVASVFLFFRADKLDWKQFKKQQFLDNQHILREVEKFLNQQKRQKQL